MLQIFHRTRCTIFAKAVFDSVKITLQKWNVNLWWMVSTVVGYLLIKYNIKRQTKVKSCWRQWIILTLGSLEMWNCRWWCYTRQKKNLWPWFITLSQQMVKFQPFIETICFDWELVTRGSKTMEMQGSTKILTISFRFDYFEKKKEDICVAKS